MRVFALLAAALVASSGAEAAAEASAEATILASMLWSAEEGFRLVEGQLARSNETVARANFTNAINQVRDSPYLAFFRLTISFNLSFRPAGPT